MSATPTILFVCQHGSAKSVIAAEHFRRLADEARLDLAAATAGLEPDDEIPPHVTSGLLADGFNVSAGRPRRVSERELADAHRIVSFGCDLAGLAPPGMNVVRWDDVPLVSDGYTEARDAIIQRLRVLLNELARARAT